MSARTRTKTKRKQKTLRASVLVNQKSINHSRRQQCRVEWSEFKREVIIKIEQVQCVNAAAAATTLCFPSFPSFLLTITAHHSVCANSVAATVGLFAVCCYCTSAGASAGGPNGGHNLATLANNSLSLSLSLTATLLSSSRSSSDHQSH